MRAVLFLCLLAVTGILRGQPAPGDQCLGGTLVGVGQDSVTLKFNQERITTRLAADAEIWRRGVDLKSVQELVLGESIYLKCGRGADGGVVASVVAAVEKDDGVNLEAHHLAEIRVCVGKLIAMTSDRLTMKNDKGVCVVRVNPGTEIWRGEVFHDTSALQIGDEVGSRATVRYPGEELTAEFVEANVAKAEGRVVAIGPDRIWVKVERVRGRVTVLFDARTKMDLDLGKIEKGAFVLAVGLGLGHDALRATSIAVEK